MHAFDRDFDFMEPEPASRPNPWGDPDYLYETRRDDAETERDQDK